MAFQDYVERNITGKGSTWSRWMHGLLTAWLFGYFALFMLPESLWQGVDLRSFCAYIYPQAVMSILEQNTIIITDFPMSAYALWAMAPFFILGVLIFYIGMLWSPHEFHQFILLRKDGEKKIIACIICIVVSIAIPLIKDYTGVLIRPHQNKLPFFILYGCGVTLVLPIMLSQIICDLRARLYFNNKPQKES